MKYKIHCLRIEEKVEQPRLIHFLFSCLFAF